MLALADMQSNQPIRLVPVNAAAEFERRLQLFFPEALKLCLCFFWATDFTGPSVLPGVGRFWFRRVVLIANNLFGETVAPAA